MNEIGAAVKAGGKRMTILGVIAIILGILAILTPAVAGTSVLYVLGVLILVGGIFRIIWAFGSGSVGKGLVMFAIGVLTLLCGIGLLAHPLFASGILTIILAVYFILDGIAEIVAGFKRRPASGWGWLVFGGLISILLGVIIWKQFPLSGIWAIGILLGVKMLFVGLIMLTAGSALRSLSKA